MADKPQLPDLPDLEAPAQQQLDFANKALRRRWNLIARVRKYGNVTPLLVLVFEQGDELRLATAQHGYGAGLIDALVSFDGQVCPTYTRPQLRMIYATLVRAADVWATDTTADTLLGDVNTFLTRCLITNDQPPIVRPDEHDDEPKAAIYRAVRDFQTLNLQRSGHPTEPMPIPLFWIDAPDWHGNQPAELWVPRQALQEWLRARHNHIGPAELRNTLDSYGWQIRHLQVRNPSDWLRRAHTRVWVVPVPWEYTEIDLLGTLGAQSQSQSQISKTSPGGTHIDTHARERQPSRARNPGDAWGRHTGPGGTLKQPGDVGQRSDGET